MPSFDVVSEIDAHELSNAIDQANREVSTRFDFKDSGAKYELKEFVITMHTETDFQLKQMLDILKLKLSKRNIDIVCMDIKDPEIGAKTARQEIKLQHGIDTVQAKKIVKMIKDTKIKVQAAIQGEQVRITGKKRDDLQSIMTLLKESSLQLPLQFNNFRD